MNKRSVLTIALSTLALSLLIVSTDYFFWSRIGVPENGPIDLSGVVETFITCLIVFAFMFSIIERKKYKKRESK
ncbi:hypothetical protein [Fictibacillus sp. S7]|uniref:hypothetical protein n=1 Tax=Fictibacillus sp. S7 TaxID=2212476 RepID=UPI0010126A82|nr:hypothetical protein [Fictibacillus sp. S7]RXZ01547.1 hypothetical protein DMO16_18915 [Fictibacillus sp. S7]